MAETLFLRCTDFFRTAFGVGAFMALLFHGMTGFAIEGLPTALLVGSLAGFFFAGILLFVDLLGACARGTDPVATADARMVEEPPYPFGLDDERAAHEWAATAPTQYNWVQIEAEELPVNRLFPSHDLHSAASSSSNAQRLVEILRTLGESGQVLYEHYIEGKTIREIAETLGVPATTVRSRLKRGLQYLRSRTAFQDE